MCAMPALSGRCYLGKRTASSGPLLYTAVAPGNIPMSFIGNSYYERRFANTAAASIQKPTTSLPPLYAGDLLVKVGSATPASMRDRRVVDVTGICTSYFDASERYPHARCRVDDVVHSMHLHDGHEVPELNRGVVALGKLVLLCAFPRAGACTSLLPLENAAGTLLRRSSLEYYSEVECMQLVRVVAESCRVGAASALRLRPVMRGGSVVSVRLQ